MTGPLREFQFAPYVPRLVADWQSRPDASSHLTVDGTVLFADVSGFTRLSDELAKQGRIGSEQVTAVLNDAFAELLDVAALDGGDLIHFGGDALFLLYDGDGHAARAARSAFDMRQALDAFQQASSPVPLAMSMGLSSGPVRMVLAGTGSRYLIATGATVDETLQMESAAGPGQILLAPSTVALVPGVTGAALEGGALLTSAPDFDDSFDEAYDEAGFGSPGFDYSAYVPSRLHHHITVSFNEGLHRLANVAFIELRGISARLEVDVEAATAELDELVTGIQGVADRYGVCVLAADVAHNGAKLMMATGVPERTDAEEERILRSVAAVTALESPIEVSAGAARGRVFACDLGSRVRRVYTAIGATTNLAARLAAAARPGTALVTGLLLDRSSSIFEATRLPPMQLKGKAASIEPYELGSLEGGSSTGVSTRHPLVGRDEELAILLDRIGDAERGTGAVVGVVAESGMGKTRLVQELVDISGGPTVIAVAEPYETSTAYYVAGQVVRRSLGLSSETEPDAMGEALAAAVARTAPALTPWVPLIARVAGASVPATPESDALGDEFQSTKTSEVIADVLASCLGRGGLVVVDAAEWVDAASHDVLRRLVDDPAARAQLICVSGRPGSALLDREGLQISLGPLPVDACRQLLAYAVGDTPLPVSTRNAILERAGGVPSFLLALTTAALDGREDLPETIEAAGEARIDRLSPRDRRLLRYASVLGREFTLDLFVEALPDLAPDLDDHTVWERLGEFLETTAAGRVRFRHPVLRDVAYNGLPFGRRAELHRAVGEALERKARQRPERYAERLALHFGEAGDQRKAWDYSRRAADRARRVYANVVAADLYRRALKAAAELGSGADGIPEHEVLATWEALGDVTDSAGLLTDALDAYRQASGLASGDPLPEGRLLRKAATVQEQLGSYDEALTTIDAAMARLDDAADGADRQAERLEVMLLRAGVLSRKGDVAAAADWCLRVLDEAEPEDHPAAVAHACYLLEHAYTRLNHPDRGARYDQALSIYRQLGDLSGEAKVLNNLGNEAYFRGEWDQAAQHWEASADAAERVGDVVLSATIRNNLAEIDIDSGRLEQGEDRLRRALDEFRGAGYPLGTAFAHTNLARVAARFDDPDEARSHLDEAERLFEAVGSRDGVLDVRRRRAELLLAVGAADEAMPVLDGIVADVVDLPGSAVLWASVERLRGFALAQSGDDDAALEAWTASLARALDADARYEEALTLDALSRHAVARGLPDRWGDRARAILSRLGADLPPRIAV